MLGTIAERHGVGVSQLRAWNNIRGSMIRVGQRLTIYVPKSRAVSYTGSQPPVISGPDSDYIYYKVQKGDTLWDIARLYPGVSSTDIKRINNLANDKLIPGQLLKIKPKTS